MEKTKRSSKRSEKLDEVRKRVENLLTDSPAVFYICKIEKYWACSFVSENITKQLGYTPSEFCEKAGFWTESIHPDDRQRVSDGLLHLLANGHLVHEYRFIDKSGKHRWVRDESKLTFDAEGNPIDCIGFWLDITDRKSAEEELQRVQARTESVLASVAETHILFDRQWRYTYLNEAASRAMGRTREEVLGRTLWEVFPDIVGTELDRQYRRAMDERVPVVFEYYYPAFDTWWENRFYPAPEGLAVFATDITGHKRAQEALRESEKKFRSLFESSHDVILFSDRAGNIIEINPCAEQLTGYTRSELGKMNIFDDLIIAEDQSIIRQVIQDIFEGRSRTYEERWKTKGGETIWFEGLSVPRLSPKGEVLSTFCTLRDITERKRVEDELRRSERVLRKAEELGHTGSWEHNLITGEIFNSEENARMFFGDDSSKGARFEDYADAVHPDDRVFVIERHAQLLAEGGPRDIEFRVVWPDGSVHVLFGRATVVRDESGRAVRVYGTNLDITDRELAKEALRKNQQLLQLVLATLPVGVTVVNQAGDIVLGNEASKRIWGGMIVSGRERWAKSKGFWHDSGKRITPTDWASERALSEGQTSLNELIDIETFDGQQKTIQNSSAPIRNAEGLIVGAVIVNENVTERVRAEEELRKSECKFRELFDSTLDGVYQTDAAGVFTVMNRAGAAILGYESPEEIIGRNILEYWRDPKERDAFISELKSRKSVSAYPLGARKKNGEPIELEASSSIIEDEKGNLLGIGGILRDVTGRKRAEERTYQHLKKLSALRSIDLAISSSLDIRMTLKVFIAEVITQLGVHAANVLLLNPRSGTLEYAASQGFRTSALRHSHLRVGEGYAGVAAFEKRLVSIPDLKEADTDFKRLKILEGEDFTAYYGVPLVAKGRVKGVLEIFHRNPLHPDKEWFEFLDSLALQAAIAIDNNSLFYSLERSNMDLTVAYDSTIEGWSRALDYRDKETEGHSQRVTVMTVRMAREMGMSEEELVHVRRGALLHDIGKMGIPDNILLKPGPLTEEEWKIMRLHPVYAYDLLYPIPYLRPALDIPYCHHEKWDGSGYPRGLKAEQIPLSARIFAVVDVWDALRSDRPYRPAWSEEKAKENIFSLSGIQFDPKVVQAFVSALAIKKEE